MVFTIVKIVSNLTILKDLFGCNYIDTNNLLELYNDFSYGAIDKAAPIAQSASICASAGRSKCSFFGFVMLWFIKCIYERLTVK